MEYPSIKSTPEPVFGYSSLLSELCWFRKGIFRYRPSSWLQKFMLGTYMFDHVLELQLLISIY